MAKGKKHTYQEHQLNADLNEYGRYDFGMNLDDYKPLTDNYEARALFDRMMNGDQDAVNEFYERFARFVKKVITDEWPDYAPNHIADIFDEAWVEIMQAYPKYDPDKGSVTAYFYYYIQHAGQTHLSTGVNALSPHRAKHSRELNDIIKKTQKEKGRVPDEIELALATGKSAASIKKIMADIAGRNAIRLDDGENHINVPDPSLYGNPEEAFIADETMRMLKSAIEALPWDQREVLIRKNGILGHSIQIESDISKETGIPVQNIPRLEQLAQKAIRANRKVRSYYYDKERDISQDLGEETLLVVPTQAADRMMDDIAELDDFE